MPLSPDFLFSVANPIALLGWALLVLAPHWRATRWLVLSGALPLLLALAYALLIGYQLLGPAGAAGGFGSLAEVAALFRNPWALLAGWVHYLCFDLCLGIWESLDARRRGVPHGLLVPCLVLTFLLGPVGLLLYAGLRRFYRPQAVSAAPAIQ
ncbi:DUF4281 domain-containing protein [Hymenobacter lapidiphilus]|uniref:ABA4-like family protein n=1 Tax=Hymenobacter sp. CCM 8763 TaxID=2303334 RepID=UPI000E350B82|nr:ABA4-like family protein [Hymenobacter sp. CCM 8763]RFP64739.1 DUF4281 domain-containing protein [Hymenobacter sp. CCM 8763]